MIPPEVVALVRAMNEEIWEGAPDHRLLDFTGITVGMIRAARRAVEECKPVGTMRGLVKGWRKSAVNFRSYADPLADAFDECADDLEELLPPLAPAPVRD